MMIAALQVDSARSGASQCWLGLCPGRAVEAIASGASDPATHQDFEAASTATASVRHFLRQQNLVHLYPCNDIAMTPSCSHIG